MKTPVKIALAVVIFIALAGIGGALYLYNLKPKDLQKAKPHFIMTSVNLQKEFETNEVNASTRYINKIIEVTGEITSVKPVERNFINVSLRTGSDLSAVICTFPGADTSLLKPGNQVTLRGVCSGFLMDVLLNNCAIIKNPK
jgi:hypothetical protein